MLRFLKSKQFQMRDFNNLFVGAFIMTAIAMFFIASILTLQKKNMFEDKYVLFANFEQGQGVSIGTQIQINGVAVGKVDSLGLRKDGSVRMKLIILDQYQHHITTQSTIFAIRPKSLISDRALNITHGEGGYVLEPNETLASKEAQDIETLLAHVNELIGHIEKIAISADTILNMVSDPKSTIGALINDRTLYDKINTEMDALADITGVTTGLLRTLSTRAPGILDKVDSIADNTQELTQGATNTLHGLNKVMFKTDSMMTKVDGLIGILSELMIDSEDKLERVDDLVKGVSSYWFIRTKIPQKNEVLMRTEEAW